jgi:hypothetical protein
MADAAIAGGGVGPVAQWRVRVFGAFADRLAAEGERRLCGCRYFSASGSGFISTCTAVASARRFLASDRVMPASGTIARAGHPPLYHGRALPNQQGRSSQVC